jgi:hypothetical protein
MAFLAQRACQRIAQQPRGEDPARGRRELAQRPIEAAEHECGFSLGRAGGFIREEWPRRGHMVPEK